MKNLTAIIVAALTILLLPYLAYSQKAEAPKYKDGDWWRVKAKVVQKGYSRSGRCDENYSEYLVKWEKGKPRCMVSAGLIILLAFSLFLIC